MSKRTGKNKGTGSALLSTLAGRHHEPSRFRRLGIEVLEDRRVLDTAWLDPHGLFPGEQFPVGVSPVSVAVADLNGDGIPDLITANGDSNDLSVLLGRGDGTFQAQDTFPVGTAPRSVAVADFNRDGIPDLVTANYGSRNVSVLLGRGGGDFEAQKTFSASSFPMAVLAADVNGDGNWEVLTTGREVSVLSGAGDGTFDTRDRYAVGASPFGLAVADINGDGVTDLVTANRSGNNVSVLLGRGGGKFEGQIVVAAGACPKMAIAVADLNGNGILDVATSTRGGGNPAVAVLLGLGDGTFAAYSSYPVDADPQSLAVADVNRDGLLDLITANEDDDTVSVLLGFGDGTFQPHQTVDVGRNPASVAVVDVNGNGIPDLVTANSGSSDPQHTLSVLLGRGDGTFHPHATYAAVSSAQAVAAGDLNGDGLMDLVTAGWSGPVSLLFRTPLTHSPAGVIHRSVQSVTIRFPSPMDTASFSLSQDVTSFTGPNGPITPSGFTWLNDRTLRILFPLQSRAGDYEMVLGPAILDAAGNSMEQPYLASFHVIVAAWQNPGNRFDVDGNGHVAPLDVLTIINQINLHGSRSLPPRTADDLQVGYLDVNGDGQVSPEDVLDVINYVNGRYQSRPAAEGENTTPTDQPDALAGLLELQTNVGLDPTRPAMIAADRRPEGRPNQTPPVPLLLSSPASNDTVLKPSWRPSSVYNRLLSELELPDGQSLLDILPDHALDRDAFFAAMGRT